MLSSLGEPTDTGVIGDEESHVLDFDFVGNKPFATFNFKYRSIGENGSSVTSS